MLETIETRLTTQYNYSTGILDAEAVSEISNPPSKTMALRNIPSIASSLNIPFNTVLHSSRVYHHAKRQTSINSMQTDIRTVAARSVFSQITIGEVSNISVYTLPLYATEVPAISRAVSVRRKGARQPKSLTLITQCEAESELSQTGGPRLALTTHSTQPITSTLLQDRTTIRIVRPVATLESDEGTEHTVRGDNNDIKETAKQAN